MLDHSYRIIETPADGGRWSVITVGYHYRLNDLQGREFFAYHWHPSGPSPITTPHLHLGLASRTLASLTSAHFPTGSIAITDLVRLLIRDLSVPPLRPDWTEVLATAGAALDAS